jgi:DNA-binding HxlR family transcriptional regulator
MAEQKKMTPSPVEVTLSIISGKWKPLIVFYLLGGTKRFSELRRLLPQTTQQMLTMQLRELEQAGILHGRSMEPMLRQMCTWGEWYSEQMGLECQRLVPEAEGRVLL